ncbi:MAG: MarR family winged helix-turn-helix transcriptional regulator [Acidimicrobiales bacterium]|jgi:DNA-binding MarR family transcriptional regulator
MPTKPIGTDSVQQRAAAETLTRGDAPEEAHPQLEARAVAAVQALTRASKVMERAAGGLSLAHYRVLAAVAAGDERASRVAARLALGKPTVSASVEALCARGLLVRSAVEGDQRAVQLSLTDAGTELLDAAQKEMISALEGLAARTGRPDEVIEALVTLGSAIDLAAAERRK